MSVIYRRIPVSLSKMFPREASSSMLLYSEAPDSAVPGIDLGSELVLPFGTQGRDAAISVPLWLIK